jgi:hypothetical protein
MPHCPCKGNEFHRARPKIPGTILAIRLLLRLLAFAATSDWTPEPGAAMGSSTVPDQKVAEKVDEAALAAPGTISPRPGACHTPSGVLKS